MNMTVITRNLIAMLAVASLVSCATLQEVLKEPEVSVRDMTIKAVSLADMQVDFTLAVKNPNPVGITLKGFSYKLDVDDQSLLQGNSSQKIKVAKKSTSSISLPLTLEYKEVMGGLEALYKRDRIHYSLSGDVDFGLFRLPYKKQGDIDVPSLPEVQVDRVEVSRMTMEGMDIVVAMKVTNPNTFPLKLGGIDYGLKLADTTVASGRSLDGMSLDPGKSGQLRIGLSLGYSKLGEVVGALGKSSRIPVDFNGRLDIPGASGIPLNWHGEVPISR